MNKRYATMRMYEIKQIIAKGIAGNIPYVGNAIAELIGGLDKTRDVKILENDISKILQILQEIAPDAVKSTEILIHKYKYDFKDKFIKDVLHKNDKEGTQVKEFLNEWYDNKRVEYNNLSSLYKMEFLNYYMPCFNYYNQEKDIDLSWKLIEIAEVALENSELTGIGVNILIGVYYGIGELYSNVENHNKSLKYRLLCFENMVLHKYTNIKNAYIDSENNTYTIEEVSIESIKISLSCSFHNIGNHEQSILILNDIIEKDNNNIQAYYVKGLFYLKNYQIEEAKKCYLKIILIDQENPNNKFKNIITNSKNQLVYIDTIPEDKLVPFINSLHIDMTI